MSEITKITDLPNWREPKIGDDVYLPTSLYLSHGRDDFIGGLCTIVRIEDRRDKETTKLDTNRLFVETRECPGTQYNWYFLLKNEDENRERFGDKRGYKDPDNDPEFNEW